MTVRSTKQRNPRVGRMLATVIVALAPLSTTNVATAVPQQAPRIFNGGHRSVENYPWMVFIETTRPLEDGGVDYETCGGMLVAPTKILTAAHCLVNKSGERADPKNITAILGLDDVTEKTGGLRPTISGYWVHDYKPDEDLSDDDLAMLTLTEPITTVEPVPMATPRDDDLYASGNQGTILGWGLRRDVPYADSQQHLLGAEVRLHDAETCSYHVASTDRPSEVCTADDDVYAGDPEGAGACKGDSGGPLYYDGKLIGVMSRTGADGTACDEAPHWVVYQRVSYYYADLCKQLHLPPPVTTGD